MYNRDIWIWGHSWGASPDCEATVCTVSLTWRVSCLGPVATLLSYEGPRRRCSRNLMLRNKRPLNVVPRAHVMNRPPHRRETKVRRLREMTVSQDQPGRTDRQSGKERQTAGSRLGTTSPGEINPSAVPSYNLLYRTASMFYSCNVIVFSFFFFLFWQMSILYIFNALDFCCLSIRSSCASGLVQFPVHRLSMCARIDFHRDNQYKITTNKYNNMT